ncbi:MAG: class I SAM-dependent methyltransferase [Actinomycetota bacterium]|nr:class I SAM-dependent methyltransferase [Actinomycetota bacterium]
MGEQRRNLAEQNRRSWNEAVRAHESHRGNLARFLRSGGSTLFPEEIELLGDVSDKKVAHLMCNAGGDSVSLASLGASVVGVDMSDAAISAARTLSKDSEIPARFERVEVYEWLENAASDGRIFDVVFASYGVACWLSDLERWADGVASILGEGGRFVLVEFHPFAAMFDAEWRLARNYRSDGAERDAGGVGDYVCDSGGGLVPSGFVEGVGDFENPEACHLFRWGLGDVVSAVAGAGMAVEALEEYPYSNGERNFAGMRELPGRRMFPPEGAPAVPLMYGLSARKTSSAKEFPIRRGRSS